MVEGGGWKDDVGAQGRAPVLTDHMVQKQRHATWGCAAVCLEGAMTERFLRPTTLEMQA